jgi:hypothetical protein
MSRDTGYGYSVFRGVVLAHFVTPDEGSVDVDVTFFVKPYRSL